MSAPGELTAAWGEWVEGQGPWHVFGGLTYDPQRPQRLHNGQQTAPPRDVALAHVRRWLRDTDKCLGGRLEAGVVALEYHKSGWPHFHPLLRLSGGLHGREFALSGQAWFRRHGFARLEAPRSVEDVSAYASKYLVKDLARGDVLLWPLRGPWPSHQPAMPIASARRG